MTDMPNPLAPLAALATNLATALNALAPHNVLAQMAKGAGGPGTRERFAEREGMSPESFAAERASARARSERAGFSSSGDVLIM